MLRLILRTELTILTMHVAGCLCLEIEKAEVERHSQRYKKSTLVVLRMKFIF